jgi:CBS domain containing-hemolysin-like protein
LLSDHPGLEQINRLIGFEKHGERIGRMEVLATIRLGREGGSLADREHRTIMNLMALTRVKVSEILTPRTVLFALPAGSSVKEATATDEPLRFARIPIYDETIDDASNYVTRYDLLHAAGSGNGEARLSEFARPIHVLPEQATVSDALEQMLALHELIALIVDEHGGVEGIVTLEDVLETLLGEEIVDETDTIADMRELARQRTARRA